MSDRKDSFIADGGWYKGNLHCHTTISDGKVSPEEVVEIYKSHGYSFLAMTDHNIYDYSAGYSTPDFLTFPAVECNVNVTGATSKCYHFVGYNDGGDGMFPDGFRTEVPEWRGISTAQGIIDNLRMHDNQVILAHPVWSRTEPPEFVGLKGLIGMEVYNTCCDLECHTGCAELYWDSLLRRGKRLWGFASDDSHKREEMARGWIVVKASELTRNVLIRSITLGSFYASTGPEITEFYVDGGEAHVTCSAAASIHFVTYEDRGLSFFADGEPLTQASFKLSGTENYVRAEVIDHSGKKAWSNPIFLR